MKRLMLLSLGGVLMAFQAPAMAAANCSTTLSDGAVKVLMPGNGSGPDVLVAGQPFLLQWSDPKSDLGPRVNVHLMRITSDTTLTKTGKQTWSNQPNIGYHVALDKLVNPVSQQFKTAKHIFVVQSSSNTKDYIQSDCFTFKSASEVFTPGLSANSPGRVWEDNSSFFQDVTNQVTKKKHSVYPNKVNIPSLYDDGDVSNAGLFSALIQEIASLRREIDTLKSNRGGMEAGQVAGKIEGVAGGLQPAYQDLYAPVEQMIPSIAGVAAQATIEAELVVINKRVNKLCQSAKDQNAAINYLFNTLAPLYPHMSSQILSIDHMCD
jgi:hypothetical protein